MAETQAAGHGYAGGEPVSKGAKKQSLPFSLQNRQSGCSDHVFARGLKVAAETALVDKEEYADRKFHIPPMTRSTFLMVFSPNGKLVASTHGDHIIYVSEVATGRCVRQLSGHPRTPWCLAFHPSNNDLLASGCLGGEVRVWDLCGASEVWCSGGQTVIASIAFHPTSDCLLVIATHNELLFWDWSRKTPFMKISTKHEKERVRYVTFDSTGHFLITGIANRLLYSASVVEAHTVSDDSEPGEVSSVRPRENTSRVPPSGGAAEPERRTITSAASRPPQQPDNQSNGEIEPPERLPSYLLTSQRPPNPLLRYNAVPTTSATASTSTSNSPGDSSSSTSSPSSSPWSLAYAIMGGNAGTQERVRLSLPARRSSTTPQSRRRIPVSSSFLSRNEASRTLTTQQNRRLFVREFANQLFSMFASYVHEMSSDSENDAVEPEAPAVPAPQAVRSRSGGVPSLTERYRRFRPLRVGRWNSNIITQSNLIIHSPNEAASGSRQPTPGERGYIFANIHVNHRIQCWTFNVLDFPPDISDSLKNIVVPKCKINNDSSVSISSCSQLLAAIIPECHSHDVKINVYSLGKESLGHLLFTHSLARNVVSISFSPSTQFLLVGFAANRLLAFRRERYPMAQIFRVPPNDNPYYNAKPSSLESLKYLMQHSDASCTYRGINCMRWAPISGQGMMYGTNTGELGILY
ncbi:activating molecule in BECN1-regulated autophagy protein 1-like [Neocloeon triangulifer]|uniref:activating molecule in BECN1-regulated autophagy protein 1-like n=1 Tax=Neocloeon triangulifer TaxID=2078957 RepID=UPI00286F6E90|nr:activating molecule in BECN1-regulated autophagy protein 1-like [Neocloeon triangulifer]XP_059481427.1 activating molecule in BECN1-regulated autophagy protein 1-like [Neocloeon triangulifer]XP_059481428.1 activating molecule in BECN1-regulated autophagy protein 1-like [Neocloeon triangulifer]